MEDEQAGRETIRQEEVGRETKNLDETNMVKQKDEELKYATYLPKSLPLLPGLSSPTPGRTPPSRSTPSRSTSSRQVVGWRLDTFNPTPVTTLNRSVAQDELISTPPSLRLQRV